MFLETPGILWRYTEEIINSLDRVNYSYRPTPTQFSSACSLYFTLLTSKGLYSFEKLSSRYTLCVSILFYIFESSAFNKDSNITISSCDRVNFKARANCPRLRLFASSRHFYTDKPLGHSPSRLDQQ
jgi:hypothetical protein